MEVSGSDDELLTVLGKFRDTLLSIPLPPPAAVDYDQALKDAQRESIEVRWSGVFVCARALRTSTWFVLLTAKLSSTTRAGG